MKYKKIIAFLRSLKEMILEQFYPNYCPFCDKMISHRNLCCEYCFDDLPKLHDVCSKCGKELCICDQFNDLDCVTAPFFYDEQVRDAIHRFKFRDRYDYARPFAEYMIRVLKEKNLIGQFDCITAVPMDHTREAKRGYNQSLYLAQELSDRLNVPILKNALRKKRDVPIQHLLSYEERRTNLKDAYFSGKETVKGKRVLLCDDVYTTGATLESCAKILKAQGAESVLGIVIAITRKS